MDTKMIEVLVTLLAVAVILILLFAYRKFRETEFWQTHNLQLDALQKVIKYTIIEVADMVNSGESSETVEKYKEKQEEWAKPIEEGGKGIDIDYRTWMVLDKIEPYFKGFIEFDTVLTLVRGQYQEIRKADNGLILNPAKDIVDAVEVEVINK